MKRMLQLLKYDLQFVSWQNHIARFGVFSIPVFLMAWSGSDAAMSLFYIVLLAFLGLENIYTNIFFRVPNELDVYTLLPLSYKQLILAKNIAAIIVTLPALLVVGVVILYFSLSVPSLDQLYHAMLYVVTSLFLLLHCGNVLSLKYPRRDVQLNFDVLTHLVFQLMAVAVSSVPYIVLKGIFDSDALCFIFAIASGIWWYFFSVPWTARMFVKKKFHILETA